MWSSIMSNTSMKIAFAVMLVLATPAASFAQFAGSRAAGAAGSGNLPISGIPQGPANPGGMNNVTVDPSGVGNASRMSALPQPHIASPVPIPQFR
jgi:hypothetical protein